MSSHNNYEPTSPINCDHTMPNPYLTDNSIPPLPPPPPPSEWYMHQRTGKAWKIFVPVGILLLGLILGILVYRAIDAMYHYTADASPTPFTPFSLPTSQAQITPTPSYIAGLSSGDPKVFVESFSKALAYHDTIHLSKHKADQFLEICQSSENPPASETSSCTNGWYDLARQLANDSIELSVNPSEHMTIAFHSDSGETTGTITGQYTNNNSTLPLVQSGTSQFWFTESVVDHTWI